MRAIRSYEMGLRGETWGTVINATSAGKAKSRYFREIVSDVWPDARFIDVTCRAIGGPRTVAPHRVANHQGLGCCADGAH